MQRHLGELAVSDDLCSVDGCYEDPDAEDVYRVNFGIAYLDVTIDEPMCESCAIDRIHELHDFNELVTEIEVLSDE